MRRISVLVTGAGGSAGHNVAWSLKQSKDRSSITLVGTDYDHTNLQLNQYLDVASTLPKSRSSSYLHNLQRIARRLRIAVAYPQPDDEVRRISENREKLPFKTPLPPKALVRTCLDKFRALVVWNKAGLRQPVELAKARDFPKLRFQFPVWVRARYGAGGAFSARCSSLQSLRNWTRYHTAEGFCSEFIVEEDLPGRNYCFMSLWKNGNLVTSLVRERLSWVGQRSVGSGGTSKLNRIVHSRKVNEQATRAITALLHQDKPDGILCVDLKEDSEGFPKPTEINCRFTTNVHYITLASLRFNRPEWNLPWLSLRLLLEKEVPRCRPYDALPDGIWFSKNTDMGFNIVKNAVNRRLRPD